MGNTVWILSDSRDEDDWDHSYIIKFEKSINQLCKELGLKKLVDFYDYSVLAGELDEEIEPNYVNPSELEPILTSLISAIKEGKSKKLNDEPIVLEELEDCLSKIAMARAKGERVRVTIVP